MRLVIPPHVTVILRCIRCARMPVAHHALAGRDGSGKTMLNGMSLFVLGNGWIAREAESQMAARGVGTRVGRIAIVRIHHVAGCTSRGAVVARLIVGS